MDECADRMTIAARGPQWSGAGMTFPDGYVEAVTDDMADIAPCARWDPARSEVHACASHAADLAEEIDHRQFELGLVGPDAWLDDQQVEELWDAHRDAHPDQPPPPVDLRAAPDVD